MKLKRIAMLVMVSGLVLVAVACQQQQPAEASPGSIRGNQAYIDAFGQPPVPSRGSCFARVGYYPLRSTPQQLRAVPFFLFNVDTELPLLFERLVNNPLGLPADGPMLNPFPQGTGIQVKVQGDLLELALQLPKTPSAAEQAQMAASLVETAGQYTEIKQVRLLLNGGPWPGMPAAGFVPDRARIADPGPPQLLLVIGSWEAGAAGPEEILADFDRPVTVERFSLSDAASHQLTGDYFTGAFDMAVVLHPEHPEALHQGMTLRASWQVSDKLGRSASGEREFMLLRQDHGERH